MNRKSTLVAAAVLAASSATFAIEAEQLAVPTSTSLSREEVKAELRDLQAAGALPQNNESSLSPLEAREIDLKRSLVSGRSVPVVGGLDRAAGDAILARYAERVSDAADPQVTTTTLWVPVDSVLVIEVVAPAEAHR